MENAHEIATVLGMNLWTTDWFIPEYRPGENGNWKIIPGGQLVHDWGYFTGTCLVEMFPALARKSQRQQRDTSWDIWMSLTPHEIESQELACRHAYGQVVVMGLGMGWVAANIALKKNVTSVVVIEKDIDVINLIEQSGTFPSLPESARSKIAVIHADALEWRPSGTEPIDFLYADIWLRLAEPGALNQVKQMQSHVQAEKIYYWGQELAIYHALKQSPQKSPKLTADDVKDAVKRIIQLPLLIPTDCDYPLLIEQVIKNRIQRKLPIDFDRI